MTRYHAIVSVVVYYFVYTVYISYFSSIIFTTALFLYLDYYLMLYIYVSHVSY